MTRGFQIFNSAGDSIDLLNNLDFFSINPEGLGVSFNNDYHETNSNYLLDSSKMNMGQFNIDIIFGAITGESYQRYDELLRLLDKPPYVLVYETVVGKWSRACKLNELTKTEIKELDVLIETITLDLTTPWYIDVEESYVPTPQQEGDGKIYREAMENQDETIYNYAPTSGYEAGDRWNWDKTQTWLGCNLISRKLGLNTPLELQGWSQTNGAMEYVDDGLVKVTQVGSSDPYYFSGSSQSTGRLTEDFLDQIRGQTVFVTVKKPRASSYATNKKPAIWIYYWLDGVGDPITLSKEFNGTEDLVQLSLQVPMNCSNILVAMRYSLSGFTDMGTLAFNELGLQINNPVYEQNPSNLFGNIRGSFTAIKSNGDFNLEDWVPSPAIFTEPPVFGYDIGDIWRWNETQEWLGMNMVCINDETNHFIAADGSITSDPTYKTTRMMQLRTQSFNLVGNRTSPVSTQYSVRVIWYDSDGVFISRNNITYQVGTAASANALRPINAPENATQFKLCIEKDPAAYMGATTANSWSQHPKDFLKGRSFGTFTPVANNTKLDFNDLVEYSGGGSSEATPIPLFAYYEHYYNYIYGTSSTFFDQIKIPTSYTYDYIYEGRANGDDGVFMVDNDSRYIGSAEGSPIEITIHGPASNPYWYVVVGSEIVQSDGYNLDIAYGSKLVVSSVPGEQRAVIVNSNGQESNVYQSQRLDLTNFVTLPAGISQVVFYNCRDIDYKYRKESVIV